MYIGVGMALGTSAAGRNRPIVSAPVGGYHAGMAGGLWHWLWWTDWGLLVRIGLGVVVFVGLAAADLARRGREATRWKEYLFLASATAAAMAYGLANDMITVTISPEYFLHHEGLPLETPNVRALAAVVALKATWSVGLVLGVAMLLANNPSKRWPQLPYRRMYPKLLCPFLAAGALALLGGASAWCGWFDGPLGIIDAANSGPIFCVYYAHLGAYLGGLAGGIAAVVAIRRQRRRLSWPSSGPAQSA